MAEEILNDFYPDFNELESKVGRKTPESLLVWMKDAAADCEGWTADPSGRSDHTSDGLSDKINTLKQEMRWLRCADVRILRQLVAVHEGIEAMRWLMEERGLQTSRCSSLSGSLSSLVTIEEHTSELQSPSESIQVESYAQAPLPAANSLDSADTPKSEALELGSARFHIRNGAETIKRALLRSSRRKQLKAASQDAGEKNSERPTQQSLSVFNRQEVKDEDESSAGGEKDLLGYDAQWSWVESKDDVTFL
ncbi:leucine rich adaptor protein 1-like isoform X2 [Poecilia formosa]|uniref:leucine rich adaptor protein 1-like isoform X2 n=1 Tax=Poecilia formosa TaxID=48698 RepID=UPI0007B963C1|nr:PREDICTED: leucine rich adaptor protein 1-like isoform X2 [Poecilia formosa]